MCVSFFLDRHFCEFQIRSGNDCLNFGIIKVKFLASLSPPSPYCFYFAGNIEKSMFFMWTLSLYTIFIYLQLSISFLHLHFIYTNLIIFLPKIRFYSLSVLKHENKSLFMSRILMRMAAICKGVQERRDLHYFSSNIQSLLFTGRCLCLCMCMCMYRSMYVEHTFVRIHDNAHCPLRSIYLWKCRLEAIQQQQRTTCVPLLSAHCGPIPMHGQLIS